jgi:uncharacterized MnhB-related membrane protein
MLILLLVILAAVFAVAAMRAGRLLTSAIWLAGVSALVSVVCYILGAHQVAVIELSVGAGLVTVLFVFAISIAGDDRIEMKSVIPWPLVIGITAMTMLLLGWYLLPALASQVVNTPVNGSLSDVLWQNRGLDVLVQVVLIFAGVLGLLGLLAEVKPPLQGSAAEEISAARERELQAMEDQFIDDEAGKS